MARIRTIKPQFFKNEEIADLSPFTRLLFIGLWLLADVEGKLEDRPKRIKAELFPYDDFDVDESLSKLQESAFINRYDTGAVKVIQIINFTKHQRITGSEANTESEFPDFESINGRETSSKQNGNTLETPGTTGREGKGREKEGKGKGGTEFPKHTFSESEIFNQEIFEEKLKGTQYEQANIPYYHEVIKNWADSKNEKKFNWLAAAKNWMASDMKDGKFITKDFKPAQNGGSNPKQTVKATGGNVNTARAFDAIDRHYGKT